jgi:hypothetical protein
MVDHPGDEQAAPGGTAPSEILSSVDDGPGHRATSSLPTNGRQPQLGNSASVPRGSSEPDAHCDSRNGHRQQRRQCRSRSDRRSWAPRPTVARLTATSSGTREPDSARTRQPSWTRVRRPGRVGRWLPHPQEAAVPRRRLEPLEEWRRPGREALGAGRGSASRRGPASQLVNDLRPGKARTRGRGGPWRAADHLPPNCHPRRGQRLERVVASSVPRFWHATRTPAILRTPVRRQAPRPENRSTKPI